MKEQSGLAIATGLVRLLSGGATAQQSVVVPEMVIIQPGEIVMGTEEGDIDERPAHTVRVTGAYVADGCAPCVADLGTWGRRLAGSRTERLPGLARAVTTWDSLSRNLCHKELKC